MASNSSALIVPATPDAAVIPHLRPPKGLLDLAGTPWWLWAVAALLLLAAVIAFIVWRRRNTPPPPEPAPPTPGERVRTRLREALALINTPLPFCTELADAMREYLDAHFQLRSTDQTTEELVAALHRCMMVSTDQRKWIADFLSQCDLAKFAKARPPMTELLRLQNTALGFVQACEPPPLPSPPQRIPEASAP